MHMPFSHYLRQSLHNFTQAMLNIIMFLPYFFSIPTLIQTLFSPWKNIAMKRSGPGFSFSQWSEQISYNLVSRAMGCVMRLSIIVFYALMQTGMVIAIPVLFVLYIVLIVPRYIWYLSQPTRETQIASDQEIFITKHSLEPANIPSVTLWYQSVYLPLRETDAWWMPRQLFSIPPIGRDWAMGYTPTLDQYGQDLCDPTYQSHVPKSFGREKELQEIEQALLQSQNANIIVVGEEGVGKDTIIEAFARRVYEGRINRILMYKRLIKLNMEKILTQYTDSKQRETFVETLFAEAASAKNILMCIEHIDKYISSGTNHIDLSAVFEKFGKIPDVQFIGITTPQAYQTFIVPNETVADVFTKIAVSEISKNQAQEILLHQAPFLESRYRILIPFETVREVLDKSDYFITTIPFPEKAIHLLEEGCIYTSQIVKKDIVLPSVIDTVVSSQTHIPTTLTSAMRETLLHLESLLTQRIIDQPQAIAQVSATMRRAFLLIGKRKKPLASLLFVGPTGVGKTETAKALCELVFQDPNSLIRFDMSEFLTKQDVTKLIGSTDMQNPGLLTKALREKPYGVLLLDEIEKADINIRNIFLTILDEGYFTDGNGKRVDCKNLVIIATSNAGGGITQSDGSQPNMISYLINSGSFPPEFLNRFDGIIAYLPLDKTAIVAIARHIAQSVSEELHSTQHITVTIRDTTLQQLIDTAYNPTFGARDMERILRSTIEDAVAKKILSGQLKPGDHTEV